VICPRSFPKSLSDEDLAVTDEEDNGVFVDGQGDIGVVRIDADASRTVVIAETAYTDAATNAKVLASIEIGLDRLMELLRKRETAKTDLLHL
jgi:hypothetical protein